MSEVSADRNVGKHCLSCHHVRTASDPDPIWSCPKCGRVYEKLEKLKQEGRLYEALAATTTSRLIKCPDCGADVSRRAKNCPKCGAPLQFKKLTGAKTPHAKQLLGLIGSIVLFVGVFAPIVSVPVMGNMNYFQNGKGDGTIVLVLAVVSLVLVMAKKYRGLWFTGLSSLTVMAFSFINFQMKMSEISAQMETELVGNPFRGLGDVAMQSVQLQWGWALLVVGAGLVIASAAIRNE